jgi:erythromycin esterase-like protein
MVSLFAELLSKIKERKIQIVLLGESAHGVYEQNKVRVDLVKALHQELGFSKIFIESVVEQKEPSIQTGAMDILKSKIHSVYHTQEVLDLIDYIVRSGMTLEGFEICGDDLNKYRQLKSDDGRESRSFRDFTMFNNFNRQLESKFANDKIVIWGHNAHLMKKTSSGAARDKVFGEFIYEKYINKAFSIGQYLGSGKIEHMPGQERDVVSEDNSIENFIMNNIDDIKVFEELNLDVFRSPTTNYFCSGEEIEELVLCDHFDALILHRECSAPIRI